VSNTNKTRLIQHLYRLEFYWYDNISLTTSIRYSGNSNSFESVLCISLLYISYVSVYNKKIKKKIHFIYNTELEAILKE
jgi:hypothetical protein